MNQGSIMEISLFAITSILNKRAQEKAFETKYTWQKKEEKERDVSVECTNLEAAITTYFKNIVQSNMPPSNSGLFDSMSQNTHILHGGAREHREIQEESEAEQILKNMNANDLLVISKLNKFHKKEKQRSMKKLKEHLETVEDINSVIIKSHEKLKRKSDTNPLHFRGSKYRGVSANGKTWQVFVVIHKTKRYAG